MRICFVTHGDVRRNAGTKRAFGMAGPLSRMGHQVAIAGVDTDGNRERLRWESPDAEALFVPAGQSALREAAQKRRRIRNWKPDLVFVCTLGMRNHVSKLNVRGPKIVSEHNELLSHFFHTPLHERMRARFFEWLSVIGTDGLVCASPYLIEYFKKVALHWRGANFPMTSNQFAYARQLQNVDAVTVAKIKEIKGNRKMILYMGGLAENYGAFDMVRAVKKLSEKRDDIVFYVLGRGTVEKKTHELTAELDADGFIHFTGYIEESTNGVLGAWLSSADVFLAPLRPTIQDMARCPGKIFMYLPFKRPIVTRRLGVSYDVLGEDGFYYDPDTQDDMTAVLSRALDVSANGWEPRCVKFEDHSWDARAVAFDKWIKDELFK